MKQFFTATAFFFSTVLHAQTDTAHQPLDEVIITANKFPQKQSTTGKVVTVINKAQIEKSSGRTLSQLLNEQAGITINGALNNVGAVQTTYVRGAASGRTLLLVDGVPVNDPSMINNEYDLNLFSLDQIERIEILKGAQSTLYGSDAIGGVVNIITVNPNVTKPVNLKGTLSAGNYGTYKGNVQAYGKEGKFTYSARYTHLKTDGFSSAYDSTGKGSFDDDGYKGNAANAQLQWQATSKLSLRTFVLHSRYKADIDAAVFRDERDYTINNKGTTTGAGFTYQHDFLTLTGNYQYSDVSRRYHNDSSYLVPGSFSTKFERNHYFGKTNFAEMFASIRMGSGFTLVQGADFRHSTYHQSYASINLAFGPYDFSVPDTTVSQSALYASLIYTGAKGKLNIEGGGRLNTHSRFGSNATYTFNPSYALTNNMRLFASVASGFKAPSIYQLSNNAGLKAEKSVTYEGGADYRGGKVAARLVYFNRHINNGIDYNYITFKYYNYIQQNVQGLEAEMTYKPTDRFTLSTNYTLMDGTEVTQNRITNKDTVTYDYLLRRPTHSLNVHVGFQPLQKLYVALSGKYVSERFDAIYAKQDVALGAYYLLNAYAEYGLLPSLKLFADAQNITSQQFFDVWGYRSIPFLIKGGLTFQL